jgi:signal transduction histidine kinase/CheY-like chemotaxis protein
MDDAPQNASTRPAAAKSRETLISSGALIFCVLLTALVSSVTLLVFAIRSIDQKQAAYETELIEHNVRQNLQRLSRDLMSATVTDEGYAKSHGRPDLAWMEREWGAYFNVYFNHNLTLALDGAGKPFYAARHGRTASLEEHRSFAQAAAPLVRQVTAEARRRRFTPNGERAVGISAAVSASAMVRWNGNLYQTAVANIAPQTGGGSLSSEPDAILISAREVDAENIANIGHSLALRDLALLPPSEPTPKGDRIGVDLKGADGRSVGRFAWTPGEPGGTVLVRFSLLIATGLLLMGAICAVLMVRIRNMVSGLLAKDAALREAMAERTRARDAAEAANIAKSAFVANISHEIRTPLNGLIGMTQVIAANPLDPDQAGRLKIVQDSAGALLNLLNDILDMAKIEAGRLDIKLAPTDLRELTHSVCQPFAELAAAKGLSFQITVDQTIREDRLCDALRVRQILANLASNAVKFTDKGAVSIVARQSPGGVSFNFTDTGIGMETHRLPELFSKFSQIDGSDTRRATGAGLGLALSRDLARRMGGDLTVKSSPGHGSVFTFDLPAQLAQSEDHADGPQTPAAPTGPLRLLIAEDNAVNLLVLQSLLSPLDVELTFAKTGAEAVDAYLARDFDLVLMDIQMPEMNGVDATRAIRGFETNLEMRRTPILAVTANVQQHQLDTYIAAGMDGCVVKPIQAQDLYRMIEQTLNPSAAGQMHTAAPDAGTAAA